MPLTWASVYDPVWLTDINQDIYLFLVMFVQRIDDNVVHQRFHEKLRVFYPFLTHNKDHGGNVGFEDVKACPMLPNFWHCSLCIQPSLPSQQVLRLSILLRLSNEGGKKAGKQGYV
jgi:hypothetical protein